MRMLFSPAQVLGRERMVMATATLAALAVLAGLLVSGSSMRTYGQSAYSANASTHGIAVVDISFIFKNHARFKAAMDAMKNDMDSIEAQLKTRRDQIAQIEEQRNKFSVGTDQYKQLDERLAKEMSDFNLDMTKKRKEFLDREAKEYYKTYLEIVDAVSTYARARNIGMVIRFNGDPVDPNRREDVLREINKPVVFQNQVDITPDIVQMINRDTMTGGGQTPPRPAGAANGADQRWCTATLRGAAPHRHWVAIAAALSCVAYACRYRRRDETRA